MMDLLIDWVGVQCPVSMLVPIGPLIGLPCQLPSLSEIGPLAVQVLVGIALLAAGCVV